MRLMKPAIISIDICTNGLSLGLDASATTGNKTLRVEIIYPGPLKEWNRSRGSGQVVKQHDRIIEVNGVSGSAERLLDVLNSECDLHIVAQCFLGNPVHPE